ncbi:hypothetical protein JCM2811A_20810 [Methylorubrum rhodinum]
MLPDPSDRLLLRAALDPPAEALACFARWRERIDLNDVAGTSFRLLPLVYHHIGAIMPDDAIKARLRGIARHAWLRSRSRWHLCSAAIDRLAQRGVPFMLTKGTALVVLFGGVMELRVQSDCDILVPPDHAGAAVETMFELGFVAPRLAPGTFHVEDHRSMHGLDFALAAGEFGLLDLHWRPLLDVESEALAEEFFERANAETLNGRAVRVPSLEHVFLQAAIHGSKFEEPLRHDWMADCHLMMRLAGERIRWRGLWASAERHGLAGLLEETLDLLADTVLPPLPSRVWRRPSGRATALERREAGARLKHPADRSRTDWLALDLKRLHRSDPGLSGQPLDACLPTLRRRMRVPTLPRRPDDDHGPLWFVSGWSHIEPHGRWSDGSVAVLALRPAPRTRPDARPADRLGRPRRSAGTDGAGRRRRPVPGAPAGEGGRGADRDRDRSRPVGGGGGGRLDRPCSSGSPIPSSLRAWNGAATRASSACSSSPPPGPRRRRNRTRNRPPRRTGRSEHRSRPC